METLDVKGLKRSPEHFKSILYSKDDKMFSKKNISIVFPSVYLDKNLAKIGPQCEVLSIMALLDRESGCYCVCLNPAKQKYSPYRVQDITCNGVLYQEMMFKSDDVIVPNEYIVLNQQHLFDVFETFYLLGKIPWFLSYEDLSDILATSKKYCGSSIGDNPVMLQLITAIMTRVYGDDDKYFKELLGVVPNIKPLFKGLKDPYYSFSSSISKVVGSYLEDGFIGAITKPSTTTNRISDLLKG